VTELVIADARRFADMHALYRLFDDEGHLLYVGITGDLGQRLGDHSIKRWFPLVVRITLEWFPHRAAARLAEKRAIGTERPRYNKAGVRVPELPRIPKPKPERDLLADLDKLLGSEPVRLSALAARLRVVAPGWQPYEKITGVRLRDQLKRAGVRITNTGNVLRLDPADLRVAAKKAG
jgi:hypothetical protein